MPRSCSSDAEVLDRGAPQGNVVDHDHSSGKPPPGAGDVREDRPHDELVERIEEVEEREVILDGEACRIRRHDLDRSANPPAP